MIVWAHPCIGKTYAQSLGFIFLDWDNVFNRKRDRYLVEHNLTKENMYKDNDFVKYMSEEWEKAKEFARKGNIPLLASPSILLTLFPEDFDIVISISTREFIKRNMLRGGTMEESVMWKNIIEHDLSTLDYYIITNKYLTDIFDKLCIK